MTSEDLLHDVLNFYGVKADIFKAEEYLSKAKHPTPGEFIDWMDGKTKLI